MLAIIRKAWTDARQLMDAQRALREVVLTDPHIEAVEPVPWSAIFGAAARLIQDYRAQADALLVARGFEVGNERIREQTEGMTSKGAN